MIYLDNYTLVDHQEKQKIFDNISFCKMAAGHTMKSSDSRLSLEF